MQLSPVVSWVADKLGVDEGLCPDSLRMYQLGLLQQLVRRVKRQSAYYANLLQQIDPDTLCDSQSIQRLPFLFPADLRQDSAKLVCTSQQQIARIFTLQTSGTSGVPKRLFFSQADLELCIDFFANGMQTMVQNGDTVCIFLGGVAPGGTVDLLQQGLLRIGVTPVICGFPDDSMMRQNPPQIQDAACFVGLPVPMLQMAQGNPELRPRNILLCSDYVPDAIISRVKSLWKCEVFTHYGSTESGLGGGVECAAHDGYHLRDADLWIEIVDPDTGTPVPDGQYGEVVITTLTREAMPLIRYRSGDISRIIAHPCQCGGRLHRLGRIVGRYGNIISLDQDKTLSIHQLDDLLFQNENVLDYSASLHGNELSLSVKFVRSVDVHDFSLFVQEALPLPLSVKVRALDKPLPVSHGKRIICQS